MVIWTLSARNDLKSIHDYIRPDSFINAKKVIGAIREKADSLFSVPNRGKLIAEINAENLREVSEQSWRIVYKVDKSDVFILAIVHKRRMFDANSIILPKI